MVGPVSGPAAGIPGKFPALKKSKAYAMPRRPIEHLQLFDFNPVSGAERHSFGRFRPVR
jgi:hypothetical protein